MSYAYEYNCGSSWNCACAQDECDKTGTIKRWPSRGTYGFIKEDDCDKDLFVHVKGVVSEQRLCPGTRVKYDVWLECSGRFRAVGVREIGKRNQVSKRES